MTKRCQFLLFSIGIFFTGCEEGKSGDRDGSLYASHDSFLSDMGKDQETSKHDLSGDLSEGVDEDSHPDMKEIVVNPKAIFVALEGDDSNDGRSLTAPLRTLTKAAFIAQSGETIYVKAGDYGNELVVFENDGVEGAPITLEGYHLTPGDRPQFRDFDEESVFDPDLMPLLDGNDRSKGVAVTMFGRYLIARNLQIRNYRRGIYAYGAEYSEVHQTYLSTFGINDEESYSGKGIVFGTKAFHNLIKNSVVIDAGAEGIIVYGNHNTIDHCTVIGTAKEDNKNSTDYYLLAVGNDNLIENSRAERVGDQYHGGHGIGLKGDCENNTIQNNLAEGFDGASFYLRHRGVKHNLLKDNRAINGEMGILIRDGASKNIIEGHSTNNIDWPVIFMDTDEDEGKQFSGKENVIRNCKFKDTKKAIVSFHDYIYNDIYAESNLIENCEIEGSPYLFDVRSMGKSNMMKNSRIKNVGKFAIFKNGRSSEELGFSFENNVLEDSGFTLP